jgi:hypothetical protein
VLMYPGARVPGDRVDRKIGAADSRGQLDVLTKILDRKGNAHDNADRSGFVV